MRFCPLRWLMARVVNRQRKALPVAIPAPSGGINSRDPLGVMDAPFAGSMVNLMPQPKSVQLRLGYSTQVANVRNSTTGNTVSSLLAGFVKYGESSLWV